MRALCSNHGGGHPFPKKIVIYYQPGYPPASFGAIFFRKMEGRVPTLQPSPSAIFFIKLIFENLTDPNHGFLIFLILGSQKVVSGDIFSIIPDEIEEARLCLGVGVGPRIP